MGDKNKVLYNGIYKYIGEKENLNEEDIYCINTIEQDAREFVKDLGVRENLSGYKYIKESIYVELLNDTKYGEKGNKGVIKKIANENHTEKSNIERSMRYAIQDLQKKKDYKELNAILGKDAFSKNEYPTNLEFIFCAAEKIRDSRFKKDSYKN